MGCVLNGLIHSFPPGAPPSRLLSSRQRNEIPSELWCMGGIKGACARSRLTLSCVMEVNACVKGAVQEDWVMEQCDPWAFVVEACALFLTSDGELVG